MTTPQIILHHILSAPPAVREALLLPSLPTANGPLATDRRCRALPDPAPEAEPARSINRAGLPKLAPHAYTFRAVLRQLATAARRVHAILRLLHTIC